MCTVIIGGDRGQARSGCAWLGRLHAHVQSMMSWGLCYPLQSTVCHLSKSNEQPSFQFHPTIYNTLDLITEDFVNCELFNDCKNKALGFKPVSTTPHKTDDIFVRIKVREDLRIFKGRTL